MPRDDQHWSDPHYRQRMTTKEWKDILLREEDKLIFHGTLVPLRAKRLGFGVVEVSKVLSVED
jgi:hypothetical protein